MNSRVLVAGSARAFFSACFVILFAAMSFAQAGRGSVSGTVTDPNGAVIAGAQVELLNKATGVTLHTVASSAGLYTFISLNPGVYQVKASQPGFASVAQEKVRVDVDQVTEVDITLRVGAATETVTVTETASLVEASNSTVGSLIPAEQIDRVPLLYRNVFDLIQLSAGVIPVNGSPNSSDSMESVQNISVGRPGVDVSADTINGSLVGSVYYMLDGAPLGVAENNAAAIIPAMNIPEDGIDEVKVETQNTPASYQSGAAGVISLVSKSGTNKFHGDVFGVFRPSALSANEYFNKRDQFLASAKNTPPDFHRYQEGGAIGGPIKKDKLFFFADYEHTTQKQFEGNLSYQVPTTAERTGDFSNFLTNIDPNTNLLSPIVIYDPTQPDYTAATAPNPSLIGTRQPFTGNKITNPNPIGLLYLSNMPKCNYPTPAACEAATTDNTANPNFQMPGLDPFTANRFDVRVDWNASDKQRIFTRFSYDKLVFSTANVFPAPGWDPDYALNTTNGRNFLLADDVTLSSSTVLQLRYAFTRHFEKQGGPSSYLSNSITTQGFPSALASEVVFHQLPFMVFDDVGGGVGGTADYNNFVYASMNSDVSASVTKVKGKHELSFGFEWMKRYLNVGQPPAPAGAYAFDISATDQSIASSKDGSDFASLLIGMGEYPGNEQNDYPNFTKDVFAAESNPYYAAFFEDTFHASKSLTITAGLRWDIFAGRNERYNRQEYFDPAATNTVSGVAYTGAEIYVNGSHRSPFKTGLHDFGPRLSFAWQPVQHFVVRGGAGIYYGPATHNVASAGQNSDGFASQSPWAATCINNSDGNTVYNNPGCGAVAPGNYTADYSLSNPFAGPVGGPGGIIPVFTTAPTGLANNLGNTVFSVLQAQRTPTTYNFNFGVEYELPHQVVVSAAYVGSRGLFLPLGSVDLNQLDLGTIAKYGASLCVDPSNPACVTVANTGPVSLNPNFGAQVPLWATLQQYPQFGNGNYGNGVVISGIGAGDSEYSSLQTKVQKRLTGHFTTLATFTWGKLMTDDSNPPLGFVGSHNGSIQDWRNLKYDHSIAPQDVKYQFTGEMSYDLPFGKGMPVNLSGVANAFAGGWTANAIVYLSTGVPINSPASGTPSPSYFNQRADMVCNPASGAPHTVDHWFNPDCFAQPGGSVNPNRFVPGTAPDYLDNVRTRGARDLDLSIYKSFKFGETRALRFDISGYNMSNTPQYGYPSVHSVVGVQVQGENFGKIGKTINSPRQFQFGARFTF